MMANGDGAGATMWSGPSKKASTRPGHHDALSHGERTRCFCAPRGGTGLWSDIGHDVSVRFVFTAS